MKEEEIISLIKDAIPQASKEVQLSIGDDGSVVEIDKNMQLVTVMDTIAVDTHYPRNTDSKSIGHKVFAVNLSDIAAMGASPKWAHLSLSMPKSNQSWLKGFIKGASSIASQYNISIIGGDTIKGPEMFTVTLQGLVEKNRFIGRSSANTGDLIYVTGYLGSAAFGLKALRSDDKSPINCIKDFSYPEPRVNEGVFLSEYASSMIDLSDGLYSDLEKLTSASKVGCSLDIDHLPIRKEMSDLISFDEAISYALYGGDDYELCFTIPIQIKDKFEKRWQQKFDIKLTKIGVMNRSRNIDLKNYHNHNFLNNSFQHF